MNRMTDAVIVEVARTPVGKFRQALASFEAPALGSLAMKKVVEKAGIDSNDIDEVIFSNLFNYNWGNIARITLLEAGFPISIPGVSVNRQCASSLDSVAFAAALIMTGAAEVVLLSLIHI